MANPKVPCRILLIGLRSKMALYNIEVFVESKSAPLQRTEILTQQPEDCVLDVLLSFGNLPEPVLERLLIWGRELRALPSASKFSAGLPGGGKLIAVGSLRTPHQLALDEG